VDEELADQVWQLWYVWLISNELAAWAWCILAMDASLVKNND